MNQINSDSWLLDIEQNLRVSAGPGAGKTHWLIEHVQNVLRRSKRLTKGRKIACITYTNIGVETILERLQNVTDYVEVSTIHSFLYRHIVRPYIEKLSDEYGIDIANIDGHEELNVSHRRASKWIKNHSKKCELSHPFTEKQLRKLPDNLSAVKNWLQSCHCHFNEDGNTLKFDCNNEKAFHINGEGEFTRINLETLDILEDDLLTFKKSYWKKGVIHHDDVLFFSYKIIEAYPFVLEVLRKKFPYFFIDEFQDSNPVQVRLVENLVQEETTVGIIGDKAQSIYEFQGAVPEQFEEFDLDNLVDFQISTNRRSTKKIVEILNAIRSDIKQTAHRQETGEDPIIFIGANEVALSRAKSICNGNKVHVLSRKNVTANAIKKELNGFSFTPGMADKLRARDSDGLRSAIVISCINAIELAQNGNYKESIRELKPYYKDSSNPYPTDTIIHHLMYLLNNYQNYSDSSIYALYKHIKSTVLPEVAKITNRGTIKEYYKNKKYRDFAVSVKVNNDRSLSKTIHNSKGDEFKNVLLVLEKEEKISFLMDSDLSKEEHRIRYVAVSRAMDRLFISLPTLGEDKRKKLRDRFKIIDL